jgi:hypothetical protein
MISIKTASGRHAFSNLILKFHSVALFLMSIHMLLTALNFETPLKKTYPELIDLGNPLMKLLFFFASTAMVGLGMTEWLASKPENFATGCGFQHRVKK